MRRTALALGAVLIAATGNAGEMMQPIETQWEYVADAVMGGVSTGALTQEDVAGRQAMRLTGDVSLDNNGGFIQMATDVGAGTGIDASQFTGIALRVRGNGATYDMRLRTSDLSRPWQSYRTTFTAPQEWAVINLPFASFEPNKTDVPFDAKGLRRIGVLAYGQEMQADIAVTEIWFYR